MTLKEHLERANPELIVDIFFHKGATVKNWWGGDSHNEDNDFVGRCVCVDEMLKLFDAKYLDMEVVHFNIEADAYNEPAIQYWVDGNLFEGDAV